MPIHIIFKALLFLASLCIAGFPITLIAQTSSSRPAPDAVVDPILPSFVQEMLSHNPLDYGVFFNGGSGVGSSDRSSYTFFSAGARAGRVLTDPIGPGVLRGQFEYSAEIMPWWQANTPRFQRYFLSATSDPNRVAIAGPFTTGGTYNGISITPVILRWDLTNLNTHGRLLPFVQGAGGLIWTNHKFPPVGPFSAPSHQGTSVWNFTPQFGVGFQYFVKPKRSITLNANAVHISNASLGDANPGVNASVQFQLGYSWWK